MKKLFTLLLVFLSFAAFSQPTFSFSGLTGSVDSAAANGTLKATVSAGGCITLTCVVTKKANSGTTAGYILIQGTTRTVDSGWTNIKVIKTLAKGQYGTAEQANNVIDIDTFTLTDVSSQTYSWIVPCNVGGSGVNHPYYQYRFYLVPSGSKIYVTGAGVRRQ